MAAYKAANPSDAKVTTIDLGASLSTTITSGVYSNSDGIHPTVYGHALVAPMVSAKMAALLATPAATYAGGFHP